MYKAKIINNHNFNGNIDKSIEEAGLKIGDEIEVHQIAGNAVAYKDEVSGKVTIIYTWNIEKISTENE
jgi:hypothetical protein